MKFLSIKTVNLFTIVLSAVFFLSTIISIVASVQEENRISLEFEQLMADINEFNFNHSLTEEIEDQIGNEPQEALFDNGLDAFLFAYDNFINAQSYHVISRSTATNVVLSLTIETESKNIMIKYPNGDASYELITYEQGNQYGRTGSTYIFYHAEKNLVYLTTTTDVKKIGDDLVTTYHDRWEYDSVEMFLEEAGILPGQSIYDFNARSIAEVLYYNEVKVGGQVREYQTKIKVNPTLAGRPYAKVIRYMGAATQMPNLTKMYASAIIGANGVLKAMMFEDEFELKTIVPVLGEKTVKVKSNATYHFVTIGGEILEQRPDVSNAVAR
jgi:hypothetical protein